MSWSYAEALDQTINELLQSADADRRESRGYPLSADARGIVVALNGVQDALQALVHAVRLDRD